MLVLVLVLAVTNVLSLAVLVRYLLKPVPHPEPDARLQAFLAEQRPAVSTSGVRRVITVEILNPLELAGKRGRLAGLAGSLAPGFTRRIVHDQALRMLRTQLAEEQVVADVRLCLLTPERPAAPTGIPAPLTPPSVSPKPVTPPLDVALDEQDDSA